LRRARKAKQVVAPLVREGVTVVKFTTRPEADDRDELVIEDAELPAYDLPEGDDDDTLVDQEHEMVLEVASVTFIEGNKWRFSDGQQVFFAAVEDPGFLERVDAGREAFRKGDMLRCRVRVVQSRRADGLHTDRFVMEVIEHIPRQTQLSIGDKSIGD
jgi:hypothetical protein